MLKCNYYSVKQLHTWQSAYALVEQNLLKLACDEWLEASYSLFRNNFYMHPEEINDRLTGSFKVQLISPEFYGDKWYKILATSHFPISNYLRPDTELENSKYPDAFHDIIGHVPYLYFDKLNSIMLEFALIWEQIDDKQKLLELTRIWFFLMEFALVRSNKGYKAFGSGILTSNQILNLCLNNKIEIVEFNENFVVSNNYCQRGLPKTICLFNDVDHIISSMKQLLQKYKVACDNKELA